MSTTFTHQQFRQVLGQYPTGVVVITAVVPGEAPAALTIGSFTSVSLEPPLVAFYPDKSSTSWPRIQQQGKFCVNVLSAEQEHLCRQFSQKSSDKFSGIDWRPSPNGSPILEGAVAWMDCEVAEVRELGDHHLVVGRVLALDSQASDLPLLFFRGGYGRFIHSSLVAADTRLVEFLPAVEVIRTVLESTATECKAECLLAARLHDEFVVLASAGNSPTVGDARPTRVGRRLPYIAPLGVALAAWGPPDDIPRWIARDSTTGHAELERWSELLAMVRDRGYVIGRGDIPYAALERAIEDRDGSVCSDIVLEALSEVRETMLTQPQLSDEHEECDVRSLTVPVFLPGNHTLQIGLYGLSATMSHRDLLTNIRRLRSASQRCTELLGGAAPATPLYDDLEVPR
jgi:flavin reductase (DIM6/NTAB) family NADH-FMN oxidoreductase RutF/DNA-binding IclR family transcriptional regulator